LERQRNQALAHSIIDLSGDLEAAKADFPWLLLWSDSAIVADKS
jgi:hypothetical protein